VERAAVVGEGIVVAVEGFDRSEDQECRIRRTVAVVPGQKSVEYKRTIINIGDPIDEGERGAEWVQ